MIGFADIALASLLTAAALAAFVGAASAHPHVFASATMRITATKDGHLETLHNSWWMDELFSSSVVPDFDANADGRLGADELAAVGRQVSSSIAEWSYYTFVETKGARVAMLPPTTFDVIFDEKRSQLRFSFDLKPVEPLDLTAGTTSFTNFDDTYFVAFDFDGDESFTTKGLAKTCHVKKTAPTPDEAAASFMATISALGTNDTVPEDGIRFSDALSTKFSVDCGKE